MNIVFLALLIVLLAGAGAYWWFFMRKPRAGGGDRVDVADDSAETVARPMPEEPGNQDIEPDMGGEKTTPEGGAQDDEPMPQ
ncbi:MAG: hypothetical protein A2919_01025 [Candidatus Spechtbacteria bacterium RIFCSPLOWO2_01_FULL_43_12]|uniref:Uncharacterized protein n=1 Tax=Candidatus Spechtbacteria bacterium RIFCSPLOWO2_01_FULL_43_12 TaxID=1802162 RepID=A0A1G2HH18_9BACT|nr:MAG: hypothetical protein A2919_01025 [Candidatus Spechtbacteria bacterium RIFCSPLOWO2_01_FULL_43_12]